MTIILYYPPYFFMYRLILYKSSYFFIEQIPVYTSIKPKPKLMSNNTSTNHQNSQSTFWSKYGRLGVSIPY